MDKKPWRDEEMPRTGQTFRLMRGSHMLRWLPYKHRSAEYLAGIGGRWQIWLHETWVNCRFEPRGPWRFDKPPQKQASPVVTMTAQAESSRP